jgi:hypothetical protein
MLIVNRRHRIASIALGLLVSTGATALDINVVGLFPNNRMDIRREGSIMTLTQRN